MDALGDLAQRGVVVHRVRPARVDRQRHPTLAARVLGHAGQSNRRDERLACTTSTVSRCPGRKPSRSARTDASVQMCSAAICSSRSGWVDLTGGNHCGARMQHNGLLGAVGDRGIEQILVLGAHSLGVAMDDGRKQREARRRYGTALFVAIMRSKLPVTWAKSLAAAAVVLAVPAAVAQISISPGDRHHAVAAMMRALAAGIHALNPRPSRCLQRYGNKVTLIGVAPTRSGSRATPGTDWRIGAVAASLGDHRTRPAEAS